MQGMTNLRVSVGNDSIQTNLMQVGGLQLQHLVDARTADLIRRLLHLLTCVICATKSGLDQLLTILVQ